MYLVVVVVLVQVFMVVVGIGEVQCLWCVGVVMVYGDGVVLGEWIFFGFGFGVCFFLVGVLFVELFVQCCCVGFGVLVVGYYCVGKWCYFFGVDCGDCVIYLGGVVGYLVEYLVDYVGFVGDVDQCGVQVGY